LAAAALRDEPRGIEDHERANLIGIDTAVFVFGIVGQLEFCKRRGDVLPFSRGRDDRFVVGGAVLFYHAEYDNGGGVGLHAHSHTRALHAVHGMPEADDLPAFDAVPDLERVSRSCARVRNRAQRRGFRRRNGFPPFRVVLEGETLRLRFRDGESPEEKRDRADGPDGENSSRHPLSSKSSPRKRLTCHGSTDDAGLRRS